MTLHLASHEIHNVNNEKPIEPIRSHHHLKNDPPSKSPSMLGNSYHVSNQVPESETESAVTNKVVNFKLEHKFVLHTWLGGICFPLRRSRSNVPKLYTTLSDVTRPAKQNTTIIYFSSMNKHIETESYGV